jgi:predicted permease
VIVTDQAPVKDLPPQITIRRSTEDGGATDPVAPASLTGESTADRRRPSRSRTGPPAWARSFPNSPYESSVESSDDEESNPLLGGNSRARTRGCSSAAQKVWQVGIKKPFIAVTNFMTMPLYAAVISLIVALIPPLQKLIASVEPVVGALETAGACSIPLTMVVLGAYFYEEAVPPTSTAAEPRPWTDSPSATLVGNGTDQDKRKSLPWMRNPWNRSSNSSEASHSGILPTPEEREEAAQAGTADSLADHNTRLNATNSNSPRWWSGGRRASQLTKTEKLQKKQRDMERRTIIVAVSSRMILTPLILLPFLAWYAIATKENVMDDPVFIACACLLVGSPPALTLAQITSQSAKGSNSSFERLISKTIFVSYAIMAAPTTIALVLVALLIAEND